MNSVDRMDGYFMIMMTIMDSSGMINFNILLIEDRENLWNRYPDDWKIFFQSLSLTEILSLPNKWKENLEKMPESLRNYILDCVSLSVSKTKGISIN